MRDRDRAADAIELTPRRQRRELGRRDFQTAEMRAPAQRF